MDIEVLDYIYDDNRIYFIASITSVLWEYDCITQKLNVLVDYSDIMDFSRAFARIIKIEEKIYCIPGYAEQIYCFDLSTSKFYSLGISKDFFAQMPKRKIMEPVCVGKNIYCVCRSPHSVLTIYSETDTHEICFMSDMEEEHDFFSVKTSNGILEYPFLNNSVVHFNLHTKNFSIKELFEAPKSDDVNERLFRLTDDRNGYLWGCNFKGELFKYKDGKVKWIGMPSDYVAFFHDGRYLLTGIIGICCQDDVMYLILESDYRILQYNLQDEKFEWSLSPDNFIFKNQVTYSNYKVIGNGEFLLYDRVKRYFFFWNKKEGFVNCFSISITPEILARYKKIQPYFVNFNYETKLVDVKFYLDFLKALDKNAKNTKENLKEEKGQTIHEQVMYSLNT